MDDAIVEGGNPLALGRLAGIALAPVDATNATLPRAKSRPSFPAMSDDAPKAFSKLAEELVGDLRGIAFEEPRRQVKRVTQPLAAVLEQLLVEHQIGRASPEQTIREHWAELVGPANASYSHPAKIERNRLVVLAAHAVVRNELFHHRTQIAEKIRALPGCDHVKSLNLRAG